jgi:hypothetical protein
MSGLQPLDLELRRLIYEQLFRGETVPTVAELAGLAKVESGAASASLARLADAHMLVLQRNGEILMANPFSAVPTPFPITIGASSWYGNCIWDAMGIASILHSEALIKTSCGCCGTAINIRVPDDCSDASELRAHFAIPAAHWWDDIVFN